MGSSVDIDGLANAIMDGLKEYKDLIDSDMKEAVQKTAKQVCKDIKAGAPVATGKYKQSWTSRKVSETSSSIEMVVHSKNRYRIAHLLEKGHAKRGGGRVEARPHIAPAEAKGVEQLEAELKRRIQSHG